MTTADEPELCADASMAMPVARARCARRGILRDWWCSRRRRWYSVGDTRTAKRLVAYAIGRRDVESKQRRRL